MTDYEKIVLVTRKTRLEGLVERFNTRGQARFYLEHSGGNFALFENEHETYYSAVQQLRADLQKLGKFQEIERGFLPNFLFGEGDIIVTVGIDGLVVNTAKYLNEQPLVAINPDPKNIDGVLLPFRVAQAEEAVRKVFKGQERRRKISMAEVQLNDGQSLLAFNDFFVGARSHISARYAIQSNGREEHHSSSGIIISTGAGSTGWFSSLLNMANGMFAGFTDGSSLTPALGPASIPAMKLDWEAEQLLFVVREPFVSKTSSANIVCGLITPNSPLVLHSEMAENGLIFSDGVEADFLVFNAGTSARIGLAGKKTHLVVGFS